MNRLHEFDDQGLTFYNMQRQPIFNIARLYHSGGTSMDALKFSVAQHSQKLKRTTELLAKTFGIRRIVSNDDHIWPVCVGLFVFPIALLFVVMIFEQMYYVPPKSLKKDFDDDNYKKVKAE